MDSRVWHIGPAILVTPEFSEKEKTRLYLQNERKDLEEEPGDWSDCNGEEG